MAEMKGIKLCGECRNYDYKKHKCRIGCKDDSDAQAPFYGDCPLTDVIPKSECEKQKIEILRLEGEIERLERICHSYALQYGTVTDQQKVIDKAKAEGAREIFEEIEFDIANLDFDREETRAIAIEGVIANAKKKYTEEKV